MRVATPEDLPDCIRMGVDFSLMAGFEPVREKIGGTLAALINDGGILVHGKPATGMIGGVIYTHFFNNELVAQEMFWWVDPGSRGSVGLELLEAFEQWAKDRGADKIIMVSLELNDVSRVYLKRGYKPLEHGYVRSLWQ